MGIEYLTIENNTFFGWQRCADEEINLVGQLVKPTVMFGKPVVYACVHI